MAIKSGLETENGKPEWQRTTQQRYQQHRKEEPRAEVARRQALKGTGGETMKNKERIKMEAGAWRTVGAGPIGCLALGQEKEDLKQMHSNQKKCLGEGRELK